MQNSPAGSGKVLKLYVSREGDMQRSPREEIRVDEKGVIDDKFYAKNPQRSILITAIDSYQLAQQQNINMAYGSLGENILIDYNLYGLPVGTAFKIGEAVLEIAQNCTLCKSLTKIDAKLPKLLKNDRGVFVRVVKDGTIRIGDVIQANA
jgi:MOSC domain-containing protein YiiM